MTKPYLYINVYIYIYVAHVLVVKLRILLRIAFTHSPVCQMYVVVAFCDQAGWMSLFQEYTIVTRP